MRAIAIPIIALATVMVTHAQVEIESFHGNGRLTWTAPAGSDCTVEWASSLSETTKWSRTWHELTNIHADGTTKTANVPMFYRVSSWTNGLFMRFPVGRSFVFSVSNALGQTWTEEVTVVAAASFPAMDNNYTFVTISPAYEGPEPSGAIGYRAFFMRSTDQEAYILDHGKMEDMDNWRAGEVGFTWSGADMGTATIEAIETVDVPAGTFTDCIKYRRWDDDPEAAWYEWVKPGFSVVKWIDENTDVPDAEPIVYELQSWSDD